jgi:hypothetical protein
MTNEEKQMRVEAELKADPTQSASSIAEDLGVSPTFVGKVRKDVSTVDTGATTKVDDKRARVEAELRADPNRSYREIGRAAGVSHRFVKKVKESLSTGPLEPDPALPITLDNIISRRERIAAAIQSSPQKKNAAIARELIFIWFSAF